MIPAWLTIPLRSPDLQQEDAARLRQTQLTKPPGALGTLETLAIFLAAAQGRARPQVEQVWISVFAGDHGITAENISAFPQAVTAEMIKNFSRGGAAINVLARSLGASLEVIDLGTAQALTAISGVQHLHLGPGTANFCQVPAMSQAQCLAALEAGRASVMRAHAAAADLFIGGDMGIGNTTSAAALACALLQRSPIDLTGPGTGLSPDGVRHKAEVIERSLMLHKLALTSPYQILRHLGGFEIAALTGSYIAAAQQGLPVLVDGFITTVAALMAERLAPGVARWFLYGHHSAEPGHTAILAALRAQPLLSLGMRLGEGSGAALAVTILRQACALHNDMATFAEAAVSNRL
ncbi:MAG: nicotinate-nucleotide--dimethylbenzimidazole phosphoribosyltransferase [Ferrovum sp.]|nr:nicotinate-nucleotide--dimethylbenzimidazole phosphoribosyltransferase [Ferrovum sp.]NDU88010.1 nicotinate-nucleotide--dimethylbenzimidazole phosphoribosyltransferase [Ferrovum sp.]